MAGAGACRSCSGSSSPQSACISAVGLTKRWSMKCGHASHGERDHVDCPQAELAPCVAGRWADLRWHDHPVFPPQHDALRDPYSASAALHGDARNDIAGCRHYWRFGRRQARRYIRRQEIEIIPRIMLLIVLLPTMQFLVAYPS